LEVIENIFWIPVGR